MDNRSKLSKIGRSRDAIAFETEFVVRLKEFWKSLLRFVHVDLNELAKT